MQEHHPAAALNKRAAPVHEETGREFLAFTMGEEKYGLDILTVQEIRGYEAVTRIALAA